MPQYDMPPTARTIIPPIGGWKAQTWYIVEAAFRTTNPVHDYIFFSGFLNNDEPAGYNHFDTEDNPEFHEAHYLKVKKAIAKVTPEGIINV
jgi:hypothetical protein